MGLKGTGGHQANLYCMDLSHLNLSYANLTCAKLYDTNLNNTNLEGAILTEAYLFYADLRGANLRDTILKYTDLTKANLINADIRGANLFGTRLRDANLTNIKYDSTTKFFSLACPEKGEFVGYKKAWSKTSYCTEVIVELLILEDAKRSSATTDKCRCSKAKVLSITDLDGNDIGVNKAFSKYNNSFIYKVGEIVEVDDFDENRWIECTTGIHFFMNRERVTWYFL